MANVMKPGWNILLKVTSQNDVSLGFESFQDRDVVIQLIKDKQSIVAANVQANQMLSMQDIQARQSTFQWQWMKRNSGLCISLVNTFIGIE
jgi:hypothetical protein